MRLINWVWVKGIFIKVRRASSLEDASSACRFFDLDRKEKLIPVVEDNTWHGDWKRVPMSEKDHNLLQRLQEIMETWGEDIPLKIEDSNSLPNVIGRL